MSLDSGHGWDGQERRRPSQTNGGAAGVERHITTVLVGVMTAITVWVGFSLVDLGKEQVKTSTQLSQVREDMRQVQDQYSRGTSDRYTASEARRDFSTISSHIQKLEERIDRLDRELRAAPRTK